jgi:hypothetical protein
MKRTLNAPRNEELAIEISPEADAAMKKLVGLFSDPSLASQARLRCSVEGPDDFRSFIRDDH